jgi:hypothetical protein
MASITSIRERERALTLELGDTLYVRLYTDSGLTLSTVGAFDNPSYFTEASESGYAAVAVDPTDWSIGDTGGVSTASADDVSFVITEAGSFYGYFVTYEGDSTYVAWAEEFSTPAILGSSGGTVTVKPQRTVQTAS